MSYVPATRRAWSRLDSYAGLDVRPEAARYDSGDARSRYAVGCGNQLLRHAISAQKPDAPDFSIGKPRARMGLAADSRASVFLVSVPVVVRNGTEEEMGRVDAWRVVAVMADKKTRRDSSKSSHPRESMREKRAAPFAFRPCEPIAIARRTVGERPHDAVALRTCAGIESSPEFRRESFRWDRIVASHMSLRTGSMVRAGSERYSASPACSYFSRGKA